MLGKKKAELTWELLGAFAVSRKHSNMAFEFPSSLINLLGLPVQNQARRTFSPQPAAG
jgi:hypothetical protein